MWKLIMQMWTEYYNLLNLDYFFVENHDWYVGEIYYDYPSGRSELISWESYVMDLFGISS